MTPVLKRLSQAGHVVRCRDTPDERRVLLEVTEAGWRLGQQVAEVSTRLLAVLTELGRLQPT